MSQHDSDSAVTAEPAADTPTSKPKKKLVLSSIALVFLLAAVTWLLYYLLVLRLEESTDDAYVHGDMVTISARSNGTVVEVAVEDTDRVRAGQVLVRLDPVDAQIGLLRAEGQLGQAVREAFQTIEQARQADAAVEQQRAQYTEQLDQYRRRHPLLSQHAVSKEEVDNGLRRVESSLAALRQAEHNAAAVHAQAGNGKVNDFPAVLQARAQFLDAWVTQFNSGIVSPIDGYADKRHVQVGEHIKAGQTLLTVVPLDRLWVEANYKENQLEHIRIGQPVQFTTDTYGRRGFHGKVVGLSAGTGSAFSLLPAENATGNWIKIVQRLPVRIALTPKELAKYPLRIGLSVNSTVNTHDRSGAMLATTPRDKPLMQTNVYSQELAHANEAAEAVIKANSPQTLPLADGQR